MLARGVRLRRLDEGRSVLLVPEGVVNLNAPAAATVELLDGVRSCDDIAMELKTRFRDPATSIESDVAELVDRLAGRGWICFDQTAP